MLLQGRRWRSLLGILFCSLAVGASFAADVNWESPGVHPIEMSPDGTRLFAVHTADHRVVIYDLT